MDRKCPGSGQWENAGQHIAFFPLRSGALALQLAFLNPTWLGAWCFSTSLSVAHNVGNLRV